MMLILISAVGLFGLQAQGLEYWQQYRRVHGQDLRINRPKHEGENGGYPIGVKMC